MAFRLDEIVQMCVMCGQDTGSEYRIKFDRVSCDMNRSFKSQTKQIEISVYRDNV